MKRFLKNKAVLKDCKIYQVLSESAKKKHLSFHTPGHKIGKWDITELSFSDNLSCPRGCIAEAERDIANCIGAKKSFILTDGSTSGVLSMLYAAKTLGVQSIAFCQNSHKSIFNGCQMLGLTALIYPSEEREKIPFPPTMSALNTKFGSVLSAADALFFTSPDYYGNVADLAAVREYCDKTGKLLLIDGAHGGHLHFDKDLYAGAYADMWVDGVHKNLPAFTQGALVSARTDLAAEALRKAVDIFRTTSPSYPIMASVEYAVKYPRNETLEKSVRDFANNNPRIYLGADWTKLCVVFGNSAFEVEKELENQGVYAEFCDGHTLMFYLSPATTAKQWISLQKILIGLFEKYPLASAQVSQTTEISQKEQILQEFEEQNTPSLPSCSQYATEWVAISQTNGRICALQCGMFPPCTPLLTDGERVTSEKLRLLEKSSNVFGLKDGKMLVYVEKE